MKQLSKRLPAAFKARHDAGISTETFSFYTSVSSVFSSKIEGEGIELDSYIKHKRFGTEFLPGYTTRIDDLYNAYGFAGMHELNEKNIAKAHKLLSKNIVAKHQQGKLRTHNMFVSTPDGRIEYIAASPFELETEMKKFYDDIAILIKEKMSIEEIFFLRFANSFSICKNSSLE